MFYVQNVKIDFRFYLTEENTSCKTFSKISRNPYKGQVNAYL